MVARLAVLALVAVSGSAAAQMYRCQEGGKTTYSDRPCMTGVEVKKLAPSGGPTAEDVARARMRAQADGDRVTAPGAAQPEPIANTAAAQGMSSHDVTRRIRELQVILASVTIDKEKRRATQDELDRLQRGVAQQVSAADQAKLRELRVGLASSDQRNRAGAEAEQRAIYDRYDSPAVVEARRRAEVDAARTRAAARARDDAAAAAATATMAANTPPHPTAIM